jgi:cell division septation protein DedD
MRNNETGEFELVVGNRQLLSGFFIVVLLFAVAFAMGYVVGQNTQRPVKLASDGGGASTAAGSAVTTAADSRPQPSSPLTPSPAPSTQPPPDATAGQQPASEAASGAAQPTAQPTTQPTAQTTAHPSTQPAQASQPATGEKPATAPPTTGSAGASELPPGLFWQVIAVKPEVAEAIRQTLKNQGFQVTLTQGTNNLTRVLVGPYNDTSSFGQAKTKLETTGGYHPVRAKRD